MSCTCTCTCTCTFMNSTSPLLSLEYSSLKIADRSRSLWLMHLQCSNKFIRRLSWAVKTNQLHCFDCTIVLTHARRPPFLPSMIHLLFYPVSPVLYQLEFGLLTHLKGKFQQQHRVSVERIVSGTGLANVSLSFIECLYCETVFFCVC
jgi:hypothetical protein